MPLRPVRDRPRTDRSARPDLVYVHGRPRVIAMDGIRGARRNRGSISSLAAGRLGYGSSARLTPNFNGFSTREKRSSADPDRPAPPSANATDQSQLFAERSVSRRLPRRSAVGCGRRANAPTLDPSPRGVRRSGHRRSGFGRVTFASRSRPALPPAPTRFVTAPTTA